MHRRLQATWNTGLAPAFRVLSRILDFVQDHGLALPNGLAPLTVSTKDTDGGVLGRGFPFARWFGPTVPALHRFVLVQ